MPKATREEVFAAINNERDYQSLKWGEPEHEIDAFVTYIQGYANELTRVASHTDNIKQRLDFIRKVGTLCVAALEQHGVTSRTEEEMAAARAFNRETHIA